MQEGDTVTIRTGKTIWTVMETYRDAMGECLVLKTFGKDPVVELAKDCKLARKEK